MILCVLSLGVDIAFQENEERIWNFFFSVLQINPDDGNEKTIMNIHELLAQVFPSAATIGAF